MGFGVNFSPYAAVSAASRIMGQSQRAREDEERRRRQAESDRQFALDSQRLIDANAARSFDQGQKVAEFQEGQRRFDVGLQTDAYNQQANRTADEREAAMRYAGGGVRGGGGVYGSRGGGSTRGYSDNYANEYNKLQADIVREQMERETESMRQSAVAEQQNALALLNADSQARNALLTARVPQHIQAGILEGSLRYSEHQKAERKKLQDSIAAARSDPKLTDAEKMRFASQQMQAIWEIDNSPETVPFDERPVDPIQEYQRHTFIDPDTGEKMQKVWRGGQFHFEPVNNKGKGKDPQVVQAELMAKQAEDLRKEDAARREAQRDDWQWQANFQKDVLKSEYEQARNALNDTMPAMSDDKYNTPGAEGEQPTVNRTQFDADMKEWEAKSKSLHDNYNRKIQQYASMPSQLMEPMAANFPMTPGMQQQAPMPQQQSVPAPFQQSPAAPPVEQPAEDEAPVPVASREEIDALPQGALYIAPDGSVWRK